MRSEKVIFIDRDGVINKDPTGGYVTRWEEFYFLDGSKEAIRKLTEAGYEIIVISNQAGVGKGLYTLETLNEITKRMIAEIEKAGGRIRAVFYCPHRDEDNCDCRKPKTGLFRQARKVVDVDFAKTYFIGDGVMDIEAGRNVGCRTILILSGKTSLEDKANWTHQPDHVFKDLSEAVNLVLEKEGR